MHKYTDNYICILYCFTASAGGDDGAAAVGGAGDRDTASALC